MRVTVKDEGGVALLVALKDLSLTIDVEDEGGDIMTLSFERDGEILIESSTGLSIRANSTDSIVVQNYVCKHGSENGGATE